MSSNPEQFDEAAKEFEQSRQIVSDVLKQRLVSGFQIRTLTPGLPFVGGAIYTSPGDVTQQSGPSIASNMFLLGGNGLGDPGSFLWTLINNPPMPTVPNPGVEPPIGPEERIRYSCVSGKCLQDPNGQYYGIDECLADKCGTETDGGNNKGCDCGYGLSHTVFKGKITGSTGPSTTALGYNYWIYNFIEVGGAGRSGTMLNEYELSMPNNGGNTVPAGSTVSRKVIPLNAVIPVFIDETGVYWFHEQNPLTVSCG